MKSFRYEKYIGDSFTGITITAVINSVGNLSQTGQDRTDDASSNYYIILIERFSLTGHL